MCNILIEVKVSYLFIYLFIRLDSYQSLNNTSIKRIQLNIFIIYIFNIHYLT